MPRAWLGLARNGRLSAAALVILLAAFPARAQLTVEQFLSAPHVSELTAAPKGSRLAWVVNLRGVRNIWVAEGPRFEARPLTRFTEDDGQALSQLRWTPDAKALVFVRGGAPNNQGEFPNPRSQAQGAEQALWVIAFSGGEPRRLDQGAQPAVSPRGDAVAYVKKGQIWTARLSGDPKPARLFEARGQCEDPRWSPDGSRLAFVSRRGDHSFIGVFDVGGAAVRYLDPSVDRDGEPVWSPDGKQVAFVRIPFSRVLEVFGPKREAVPWSILIADASTGRGRELWKAPTGRGSVFRPLSSEHQLFWTAQNRIVFPWEGNGWTHLYTIAAAGGTPLLLTPGDGEVEQASLSANRQEILFCSNHQDIDRRRLWRVSAAGGAPLALTSGEGIEWSPVETADGATLALLRSDSRLPSRPALIRGGKLADLTPSPVPPEFPAQALVPVEAVTFPSLDGTLIHAQLFQPARPEGTASQPAVIFLHGGPRRQMLLGWHPSEYYHKAYAFNQFLAANGYLVLSINFRSGTGYGMEFREALGYGAAGASEFQDVVAAAAWLRRRADIDPARIALWGGSYGGYLTALGLARRPDLFAAGVDLHGVHDWRTETRLFLPSDDLETQQQALRLALSSSPLADVSQWRAPVLLIHGDDDRNVEFRQTVQLAEALRRQGVEFEQLILPDEVHSFLTHSSWLDAFRAAADFFARRLAGGR